MVEKKLVVDNLRLGYNGILNINDFFNKVEDWARDNGFERELKKNFEHVFPEGKKVEWIIELWKQPVDYARIVIRLRALFDNLKEIELKRHGTIALMNQADVFIIFDGYLETDFEGRWEQKPTFFFLRAIFDKYIYKLHTEKFNVDVIQQTYDLHRKIRAFFNLYRY